MTRRRWLLVALVVVLVVGVNVLFSGAEAVDGPRSSSYATTPTGTAALAALLERDGRRVRRLRAPLEERRPPADATVFVLDPVRLSGGEAAALARFVRDGGRLVAAGRGVERLAAELRAGAPTAAGEAPRALRVAAPAPETAGVREVRASGERAWTGAGGALPLLAADGRTGAVALDAGPTSGRAPTPDGASTPGGASRTPVGAGGRLLLLADAGPLQNRALAEADNGALALGLAGPRGRDVAFVESIHGYKEATGLAAIPGRWALAVAGLALAALLFGFARGRRFGPPEWAERELDPPRRAYVEALAASLARTKDRSRAAAPVRDAARAALARRSGIRADADAAQWRRAAERLGLPDDEVAAVTADGPGDLLATGRALARLGGDPETRTP